MKIAVLGAGISGLTCALKFQEKGFKEISLYEKEEQLGGLARSSIIDGYVFDLHGGHVFNSVDDDIKNWVFSILPRNQWQFHKRNTKIIYKDRLIDYPFEYSLSEIDLDEAVECLKDFFIPKKATEPKNYYDWLRWKFGDAIAFKYMIPYNEKIWACDLKKMGVDWVEGKMPIPDGRKLIKALIDKGSEKKDIPHANFYYPLRGGIQTLVNRMEKMFHGTIFRNTPISSIERINKKFIINGANSYDLVVSTINVKDLISVLKGAPSQIKRKADALKDGSITTTLCKSVPNNISWIYIPDRNIRTHRLVYQGNLSRLSTPDKKYSSVTLENVGIVNPKEQVRNLNKKIQFKKFKARDIISTSLTKSAYILYDKDHTNNMRVINDFFDSSGIYRVGRFSERKYFNMDTCMKKAFGLVNIISKKYKSK